MNPLLIDVPEVIKTPRVRLACPRPGDGAALYSAISESLDTLRAWPMSLPWASAPQSIDVAEAYCRSAFASFHARTDFPMLMWLPRGRTVIGSTGLHRIDWAVPKFELGYWGRPAYLGRGLISEAVDALAKLALTLFGARRLEICSDDANVRSCRLAERIGFALEGVLRNQRIAPDGSLRHTRIYARVR